MTLLWVSNTYILPRFEWISRVWTSRLFEGFRMAYEARVVSRITRNAGTLVDKESVVSRWKEGGLYIRLKDQPNQQTQSIAQSITSTPVPKVKSTRGSKWLAHHAETKSEVESVNVEQTMQAINLSSRDRLITAHKVVGRPFFEDMTTSLPSKVLNAKLSSNALKDETLYYIMRSFGKIKSMEPKDNGFVISFVSVRNAISARNCLNNAVVENTNVQLQFVPESAFPFLSNIWSLLTHFKLSIPLIFVATSVSIYFLISPIRLFNVTEKLTMNWSEPAAPLTITIKRKEEEDYLKKRLSSKPSSVLVITGPHDSGKTTIVRDAIDKRKFAVRIDCNQLESTSKNGSEYVFMDNLSEAVGFKPSFSTFTTIINYVESAMMIKQSSVKTNREIQLGGLLDMLSKALTVISQLFPRDPSKPFDYSVIVFDGFEELLNSIEKDSKNENDKGSSLIDMLLKFAYEVNEVQKTAHVVFVTSTAYGEEKLKNHRMLRGRVDLLRINDLTEGESNQVLSVIEDAQEREKAIKILGGRVRDLHSLVDRISRKLKVGESLFSMVEECKSELIQKAFSANKYSQSQLWKTLNIFAKQDQIPYKDLVSTVFLGDEEPLSALVLGSVLQVVYVQKEGGGVEKAVKPFSPLVHEAIKQLTKDEIFSQKIRISIYKNNIKKYQDEISLITQELVQLAESQTREAQVETRRQFLLQRLQTLNGKQSFEQSELEKLESRK